MTLLSNLCSNISDPQLVEEVSYYYYNQQESQCGVSSDLNNAPDTLETKIIRQLKLVRKGAEVGGFKKWLVDWSWHCLAREGTEKVFDSGKFGGQIKVSNENNPELLIWHDLHTRTLGGGFEKWMGDWKWPGTWREQEGFFEGGTCRRQNEDLNKYGPELFV